MSEAPDAALLMQQVYDYGTKYISDLQLSIMPLSPTDKRPVNKWTEYIGRCTTADEWDNWCEHGAPTSRGGRLFPFNIGIITGPVSGIAVVDCDNAVAVEKCKELGVWSPVRVKTRRGMHLYFKYPTDGRVKNGANVLGQNIDVRGDGGFVVAPPSASTFAGKDMQYEWDLDPGIDLYDIKTAMPDFPTAYIEQTQQVVQGLRTRQDPTLMTPGGLDLSHTKQFKEHKTVWEQMHRLVSEKGKLRNGDGRNHWLTRYIGEAIQQGFGGDALTEVAEKFMATFYEDILEPSEVARTVNSIVAKDRSKNPGRYDVSGQLIVQRDALNAQTFPVIDAKMLEDGAGMELDCIAHPLLFHPKIVQVHGHSGSGKSLITMSLLWNVANAQHWGPFVVERGARVLYFDYEMARREAMSRIKNFQNVYGGNLDNFHYVTAAMMPNNCYLNSQPGRQEFFGLIDHFKPEVVVIDTIRSAWPGLDENVAWSWNEPNRLMKYIRDNLGMTVIWVHHSNKPGEHGVGREAGSAAQLNMVDMQMQVVAVYGGANQMVGGYTPTPEELDARVQTKKREAFMRGGVYDEFGYNMMTQYARLRSGGVLSEVMALEYGKNREGIAGTGRVYLGFVADPYTGDRAVINQDSPRQHAYRLVNQHIPLHNVSQETRIPISDLRKWFTPATDGGA